LEVRVEIVIILPDEIKELLEDGELEIVSIELGTATLLLLDRKRNRIDTLAMYSDKPVTITIR
jgi:hypothetical protein